MDTWSSTEDIKKERGKERDKKGHVTQRKKKVTKERKKERKKESDKNGDMILKERKK